MMNPPPASASPATSAGYPSNTCRNCGIMNVVPYNTIPTVKLKNMAVAKLRNLNKRISTTGLGWCHSQKIHTTNAYAAVTTSDVIQREENQSDSCPLSSAICKLAIARVISPRPNVVGADATAPFLLDFQRMEDLPPTGW